MKTSTNIGTFEDGHTETLLHSRTNQEENKESNNFFKYFIFTKQVSSNQALFVPLQESLAACVQLH
jgi:hypothetical protein